MAKSRRFFSRLVQFGCLVIVFLLTVMVVDKVDFKSIFHAIDQQRDSICKSSAYLNSDEKEKPFYRRREPSHPYDEKLLLEKFASIVASKSPNAKDDVPTVPAVSADKHLLALSVAPSRVRYGTSLTFILIYPTDMENVLPKNVSTRPLSAHSLNLWCIFDDGSTTPAFSCDSHYYSERVSFLDCPLSSYAMNELWQNNRTLRVHLASLTNEQENALILKAFVKVPKRSLNETTVTFCTSPLHNGAEYLKQWILFHYAVGVRKFVVYNKADNQEQMKLVIDKINSHYPNLVDVIQWNFSSLGLTDAMAGRYFQVEALHDCLIRYGDQSEWLGTIDYDEYIIPQLPFTSIEHSLSENFGHRIVGSVNLWSYFFCPKSSDKFTEEESKTNRLTIERFTRRAKNPYKEGREKYLYRPRFVQHLSIHHQLIGYSKQQPKENSLMLAHYFAMNSFRVAPGCKSNEYVDDTSIRDRFSNSLREAVEIMSE